MIKNISRITILTLAGFGLAACGGTTTNVNTNTARVNSNTAIIVNSNSNMAMNSNAGMNMNTASNMSKNVSSADKEFMDKAAQGGMEEVQLGQMAASKAQNNDVKAFGQKMVEDHSNANSELKSIAMQKGVTLPTDVSAKQKENMDKLSKLSGAAFDKEYVKMMVADHEKDVADFQKQSDSGTDADLKSFATKTLPTLKSHLEMIKGINAKMK
ncbi:MAG: DUF4142 domain-containing protein [Acidobacteriota bacterium]|nr:DUF4142 domain-containing protein [Acidobacteriota bacterium]